MKTGYIGVYQRGSLFQSFATAGGGPTQFLGSFRTAYSAAFVRDQFLRASGTMRKHRFNDVPDRRRTTQPVLYERRAVQPA